MTRSFFHRYVLISLGFLFSAPDFILAKAIRSHAKDPLIVLFHGMADEVAAFSTMQTKLTQTFPKATVIALASCQGSQSLKLSIQEQVEANYKELHDLVSDIANRSIILIGHSQGGARAYAFYKQYEHLLNMKGLVALATPWEGTPGARVDSAMLSAHLTDAVLSDLRLLSLTLHHAPDTLVAHLKLQIARNQNIRCLPGACDLKVNSPLIQSIGQTLPNARIPILAIAGVQNDFRWFLPNCAKVKYSFKALNNMYTLFVVGENCLNRKHDMWIPLYSQHALNIIPKTKKNFIRVLVKDAFHSVQPLWGVLEIPSGGSILSHPRVLQRTILFIKKILV